MYPACLFDYYKTAPWVLFGGYFMMCPIGIKCLFHLKKNASKDSAMGPWYNWFAIEHILMKWFSVSAGRILPGRIPELPLTDWFIFSGECWLLRKGGGEWRTISCFIPVFGGSGQSYLGAILLRSLSDTHSSSAEQGILLLSLGVVKNNKLYLKIGDAFYVSCKLCTQRSPSAVQMHQQFC